MTPGDIHYAVVDLTARLKKLVAEKRVARIDMDCIRFAVAGYLTHGLYRPDAPQVEEIENLLLRKLVGAVA